MIGRIAQVSTRTLRVPLRQPFSIATETIEACDQIVVKIETDDGVAGEGVVCTIPSFMGETAKTISAGIAFLSARVKGMNALDIGSITTCMNQSLPGNATAKASIDLACHDLMGKLHNVPVWRLLGGKARERVPCTWVLSIGKPAQLESEAIARWHEGYRIFKVKIGCDDDRRDIERVKRVREALGVDATIRVDANTAYTADRALRIFHAMRDLDLEMIEQPCRRDDLSGLRRLREATIVPILADESVMSIEDVLRLIDARAADILNVKISKVGGLYPARKIAAIAEAAHMPIVVGSNLELAHGIAASAHYATAIPGVTYACDLYAGRQLHRFDIGDEVWNQQDMTIAAPPGPGLGVSLVESTLPDGRENNAVTGLDAD